MTLEDMLEKGILERRKTSPIEISNLIQMAERKLSEARNSTISNETRLVQAYHVIMTCSIIALRAMGYRAKSREGKHYYSIVSLKTTLHKTTQDIRYYNDLRKKRHDDVYEGFLFVSDIEMNKSISEAENLFNEIVPWLMKNYPELMRK